MEWPLHECILSKFLWLQMYRTYTLLMTFCNILFSFKQEKSLLRKLLYTNAARVAQDNGSYAWKDSFLSPLFPRESSLQFFGNSNILTETTRSGAPNEECLGKRLEWHCTVFPYHFSVLKGSYVKANTV